MDGNLIEILIFLAIAVFSGIYRASKKKREGSGPQGPKGGSGNPANRPQQQSRRKSFEELLREVREQQQQKEREEQTFRPDIHPVEEPEFQDGKRYNEATEEYEHDDQYSRNKYEESVQRAQKIQSLTDRIDLKDLPDMSTKLAVIAEEEEEESFAGRIVDILQDDDEVRKAIVLKEVLERKHF